MAAAIMSLRGHPQFLEQAVDAAGHQVPWLVQIEPERRHLVVQTQQLDLGGDDQLARLAFFIGADAGHQLHLDRKGDVDRRDRDGR